MTPSPELQCVLDFLASQGDLPGGPGHAAQRARPAPPLDRERLVLLVSEHQLVPFIASRKDSSESRPFVEAISQEDLWLLYYQSGRQAVLRSAVLHRALGLLNGKVEVVLLKGAAVAPVLYREAAERPMRDIDLLVKSTDDQQRAQKILAEAGFRVSVFHPAHHHLAPLYDPGGHISIELHTNLMTPPLSAAFMAELWRRRVKCSAPFECYTLDPVGMCLHHALHALSNPVDSPLVRDLFEVAGLAARLTPHQQQEARDLAALSGRGSVIARAIRMAHLLFGSPDFMPGVDPGPYERWCRWRLEWTGAGGRLERLLRHFARERFDSLCVDPESRSRGPWLRRCALAVGRRIRAALRPVCDRDPAWIRRAPCLAVRVGANTLVHDALTGEVHLLNELGTALWEAAASAVTLSELKARISLPISDRDLRSAVRQFIRCGLLTPSVGGQQ